MHNIYGSCGLPEFSHCLVSLTSKQEDVRRQALNVFRIKLLGAEVISVEAGSRTLRDAVNEALRAWVTNLETTHYILGSAIGPHPFPTIVRTFQSVIGDETRAQILEKRGKLPDAVVACVGGGSNAVGMFYPFSKDLSVKLLGVEAAKTPRRYSCVSPLHLELMGCNSVSSHTKRTNVRVPGGKSGGRDMGVEKM